MTGQWFLVKPQSEWADQVTNALAAIRAANGGIDPPNLQAANAVDHAQFAKVIEGMVALGADVSADMIALAGLRDLGELL